MSTITKVEVDADPAIRANEPLDAALRSATSYFQEGLIHIDAASRTQTIQPEILWSVDEDAGPGFLKFTYREQVAGLPNNQIRMKRVPISQILDGVGRRSWMLRLLQSVNSRRYDQVIDRFERLIQEQEEAEAKGQ